MPPYSNVVHLTHSYTCTSSQFSKSISFSQIIRITFLFRFYPESLIAVYQLMSDKPNCSRCWRIPFSQIICFQTSRITALFFEFFSTALHLPINCITEIIISISLAWGPGHFRGKRSAFGIFRCADVSDLIRCHIFGSTFYTISCFCLNRSLYSLPLLLAQSI